MGYLYHGSSVSDLKRLEPRKSTHGTYVYATSFPELTVIFSGRSGDDLTQSIYRMSKDEPWNLVERIPNGFDVMFSNGASIYTLSDVTFKDIKTGFAELVSEVGVDILQEEKITNVYQKLLELDQQGLIKIYHYPDRPQEIPVDDSDLLERCIRYAKMGNESISQSTFARLVFLHPHLLERVNQILVEYNQKTFQKEDLVKLFEIFVKRQLDDMNKERYLESAYIAVGNIYPELLNQIDEVMEPFRNREKQL